MENKEKTNNQEVNTILNEALESQINQLKSNLM
jgi:hypothetical protein